MFSMWQLIQILGHELSVTDKDITHRGSSEAWFSLDRESVVCQGAMANPTHPPPAPWSPCTHLDVLGWQPRLLARTGQDGHQH